MVMKELARAGASEPGLAVYVDMMVNCSPACFDDYIRANFVYREEHNEIVRTVPHMLNHFANNGFFEGDCDCIATFIASVLLASGYPVRFYAIEADNDGRFDHVWVEGFINGVWVAFDPVVPANYDEYYAFETMTEYV